MTAQYTLPIGKPFDIQLRTPPIDPARICAVIPTYRDWDGLRTTLDSLLALSAPPAKIIIANDNSEDATPAWLDDYVVEVCAYPGNRGPAYARNRAFGMNAERATSHEDLISHNGEQLAYQDGLMTPEGSLAEGMFGSNKLDVSGFAGRQDFDWFYFTDTGCTHSPDLFRTFESRRIAEGDSLVAICGHTVGSGESEINLYMTEQGILVPPVFEYYPGKWAAQAVVSANLLVNSLAFALAKGFDDQSFPAAAAEDFDLGLRLWRLGLVAYEANAVVRHQFDEDLEDFARRFHRYGRGMRRLEIKHNLPSLRATPIKAEVSTLQHLADLQVRSMQEGYDAESLQTRTNFARIPARKWGLIAETAFP